MSSLFRPPPLVRLVRRSRTLTLGLGLALTTACAGPVDAPETTAAAVTSPTPSPSAPPAPDLVVRSLTAPSIFGTEVDVAVTVCNQGRASSPASTVQLYTSTDGVLVQPPATNADRPWIALPVRSLAVGQCETISRRTPRPSVPAGPHYVGAWADAPRAIAELSDANNTRVLGPVGIGDAPDLVVRALVTPRVVPPGAFAATVTLCNQGTQPTSGAVEADVFLSTDSLITTADALAGTVRSDPLVPGECRTVDALLSAAVPPGDRAYYAGALADRRGLINELLETNNAFTATPVIGVGARPELVIRSFTPPVAWSGSSAVVEAQVCNAGTAPATTELDLYASLDRVLVSRYATSGVRDPLILTETVSLAPGACHGLRWDLPPPFFGGGMHSLVLAVDPANQVREVVESDNTAWSAPLGVGPGVELYVSAVELPPVLDPGLAPQQVRARLCNAGDQAAPGGAAVRVYLSTDRVLVRAGSSGADPVLAEAWVPFLGAGACAWAAASFGGAPVPPGRYYPIADADPGRLVPELDENDNAWIAATAISVGPEADLVLEALTVPTVVDGPTRIAARVCNRGASDAPSSELGFYASRDATLDGPRGSTWPIDFFVGSFVVPPLARSTCRDLSEDLMVWAPPGFTSGYLIARADDGRVVIQRDRTNDVLPSDRVGFGRGVELIVRAVELPANAAPGTPIAVRITACNEGTEPAWGVDVGAWTSADATLEVASPADFPLAIVSIPDLPARSCRTVEGTGFAGGPPTGVLQVLAMVDPHQRIAELIETNNVLRAGDLALGYGPDLRVDRVRATPRAGGQVELEARVCNEGTAPSSSGGVQLLWSADTVLDAGPGDFMIAQPSLGGLAPGACGTARETVPASAPLPLAAAWVLAVADPFGQQPELRETNNVGVGPRVVIGPQPDLTVTRLTAPSSLSGGQASGTVEVCNRGFVPAPSTQVELLASDDAALDRPTDRPVAMLQVSPLAAASCQTLPWSGLLGGPFPGLIHLLAVVDPWDAVIEAIEDDNVFVGPRVPTGSGPNPVVTAVQAPTAVASGPINARVTVCNVGNAPSQAQVELFASTDSTYQPGLDRPAGPLPPLGSLAPGACTTVDGPPSWIDPSATRFHLLAVVDPFGWEQELIETDQVTASAPIAVGNGPDFVVESLTAAGGLATARVCNRGTSPGPLMDVAVYVSDDERIRGFPGPIDEDRMVGSLYVGTALTPGSCTTASGPYPAPPSPYYLGAVVDAPGSTPELLEDNNAAAVGPL